jgi:Helix-turn-helix domain
MTRFANDLIASMKQAAAHAQGRKVRGMPKPKSTTKKGRTDMRKKARVKVEEGSGNVFADLGLPNPEQELLKAHLTLQIYKIIKQRELTQAQAG